MSFMGKQLTGFMGMLINLNPEKNKDILNSSLRNGLETPFHLPKGYVKESFRIGDVPCESMQKKGETPKKAILLLHGGGYLGKLTNMYRTYAKLLIDGTGAKVYMPDYRLAPENLYPAAAEDAMTCWDALEKEYSAENIIVMGDSAGGNLSLVLMLKLRDTGRKMPLAGVLISPWADMLASGQSYVDNYSCDVMFGYKGHQFNETKRAEMLKSDIFYYFHEQEDRSNPYISPVFGEYHGFPECFITAATNEMLLSDGRTIAEKINAAGGKAEFYCKHKMFHVYPIAGNICKESKEANCAIIGFINKKIAE